MMPMQALEAYGRTLGEVERAKALRKVWNPSKPMEILEVKMPNCAQIAKHVYPSIQRLARCRAPVMNRDDCVKRRSFAHQRMLAAFGQCTGTQNVVFDLSGAKMDTTRVTKAMEWMRLYSSAIRCSIQAVFTCISRTYNESSGLHQCILKPVIRPRGSGGAANPLFLHDHSEHQCRVNSRNSMF